jgi:transposase InsO family protein
LQGALARTDQRFRHRSRAQSAHFDPLQPSAEEIAGFVSRTRKQRGPPDHFVSDQGRCFTGQVFRRKLRRLGVKQRFGAIGKKGSIALIERLWRTLKDTVGVQWELPGAVARSDQRHVFGFFLNPGPYTGIRAPPRGRPDEGPLDLPFRVDDLDAGRTLPVFVRKAA